jgi:hypothetical protein
LRNVDTEPDWKRLIADRDFRKVFTSDAWMRKKASMLSSLRNPTSLEPVREMEKANACLNAMEWVESLVERQLEREEKERQAAEAKKPRRFPLSMRSA